MRVYFFMTTLKKNSKVKKKTLKVKMFWRKIFWMNDQEEKRASYFQLFSTMFCSEGATCETPVRQYLNNEFSQHLVLDWYFMVQYVNVSLVLEVTVLMIFLLDTISGYRSSAWRLLETNNHQITFIKTKNINFMCSWSLT